MPLMLSNPPGIPMKLILDPYAPVPGSMSKKNRTMLQELRAAYQASLTDHFVGELVTTPEVAAQAMMPLLAPLRVESLVVLPINVRKKISAAPIVITRGSDDGTDAPPRAIFRAALMAEAHSFILGHNHPSGDPSPSAADIALTQRISSGSRQIDCEMLDHVIVSATGKWVSLRRERPDAFK